MFNFHISVDVKACIVAKCHIQVMNCELENIQLILLFSIPKRHQNLVTTFYGTTCRHSKQASSYIVVQGPPHFSWSWPELGTAQSRFFFSVVKHAIVFCLSCLIGLFSLSDLLHGYKNIEHNLNSYLHGCLLPKVHNRVSNPNSFFTVNFTFPKKMDLEVE